MVRHPLQVDEADAAVKRLVKRTMDLGVIVILSPIWIPALSVFCLTIFIEKVLRWDFGPLFITEPRFSMGREFLAIITVPPVYA